MIADSPHNNICRCYNNPHKCLCTCYACIHNRVENLIAALTGNVPVITQGSVIVIRGV